MLVVGQEVINCTGISVVFGLLAFFLSPACFSSNFLTRDDFDQGLSFVLIITSWSALSVYI